MNRKIYYNLTQIENGWLLGYPKYLTRESTVAVGSLEVYYPTLKDAYEFIDKHFRQQG